VDVILTLTTEPNRVVVPSSAMQTGQQGQYVYVIMDDMTADLRVVTPGRTYGDWTIIDKGVARGEKVVTDGQLRLVPGTKVEIKNDKSEQASQEKDNRGDAETRSNENTKTQMPRSK
jgi:multidrug efflux system membrane fusion protein